MHGIKLHTHEEREQVIQKISPLLQNDLKANFIALAVDGSYARKEDLDYSDLELIVFVKEVPKDWNYRKIIDGMLIVVVAETKESYIEKYLDISDVWYASGAGKLLTIIGDELINLINSYVPKDIEKKCLEQIQKRWPFYQEITAKVLNTVLMKDREAMSLIFSHMIKEILILMSFLNATPYVTLGSYITQAKKFSLKPEGFDELLGIFITGEFSNVYAIDLHTKTFFSSLERLIEERGLILYSESL